MTVVFFSKCIRCTSKRLANEAISFALKSIPIEQVMPATKAAKVAAYLQKLHTHYIGHTLNRIRTIQ